MRQIEFTVSEQDDKIRLDVCLCKQPDIHSRSYAQLLIKNGNVFINDIPAAKSFLVHAGDLIKVVIPNTKPTSLEPEYAPLEIIFEDDDLLVVSKPAGLVVHPSAGHETGTLVHFLLGHVQGLSVIGGVERPGIIHRLDKDTSGLMIVAKNDRTHIDLAAQIANKECEREYIALVVGNIKQDSGFIDAPVGRSLGDRKKMGVRSDGRNARTEFSIIERFGDYTLIRVRLATGRTHQIRVHMSFIKHPVAGDIQYGSKKSAASLCLERQFLHAETLKFRHPSSGKSMVVTDTLPADLEEVLGRLRSASS